MSFNSSALNPNRHNSPNKHNCGEKLSTQVSRVGLYSSCRRAKHKEKGWIPNPHARCDRPCSPLCGVCWFRCFTATSFQVCTINIFSAVPKRLGEESWWHMLLGRAHRSKQCLYTLLL